MNFTWVTELAKHFFNSYIAQVNAISVSFGNYLEDLQTSIILIFIAACLVYLFLSCFITTIGACTTTAGYETVSYKWRPLHRFLRIICTLNYLTINYAILEAGVMRIDGESRLLGWFFVTLIICGGICISHLTYYQ